ncbi:TonB-dependent receptor [Bryobacter aggregatus]|uniref:TonB-dependent receptor n=1 Tax=Bryobacter aggregatus TaxID=360054 RepID=UPI0004E2523F|nr:carboxypeptidase regulatory-like domain-containing protein [Bryobacter aggregatus]
MIRRSSRFPAPAACLALLLAVSCSLWAQFDTATVVGTIRDATGSAITDSDITLLNQGTGSIARTKTDSGGNFTLTNVRIGTYTVTAEARGFSKAVAKDIVVNVNARQRVDLMLAIGTVAETVEVTSAAALLDTDSSKRNQVINGTAIVELPLNGRAYSDLALLTTGVVKSPSSGSREGSFNVNGLRSTYNNYILDGIDNNAYGTSNQGFQNQVAQPSPDSIVEFEVITNNYSAEYGRSGGATINVAMRSGTNGFHGTAYEFLRNTSLNAASYTFGQRPSNFRKPTLNQNQFGATFSGPIVKNRVFFFTDYEGLRNIQRNRSFSSLPTLNDRLGILPVTVRNPQTGKIYPANTQIPKADISPFAYRVLNDLPGLTAAGRSNNYEQLSRDKAYADKFDAKIDGQISSHQSAFLRISQSKRNQYQDSTFPGPSGGNGTTLWVLNQQAAAAYTWTLSPTSVLEGRFGVSRTNAGKKPPFLGGADMEAAYGIVGLPKDPVLSGGLLPIQLSGFTGLGRQSTIPQFQNPLSFNSKLNYSKIFNRHSMKFGYENVVIRTQVLDVNPMYGNDQYLGAFSRPTCAQLGQDASCSIAADAASYSLADFLFGQRSAFSLSTNVIGNYRQHEHFLYVQDDFKVSSKLTLNLGLRWEFATPRWERDNALSNFDPTTRTMLLAKNGSIYDRALVNPYYKDWAPRLGFAYNAFSKTVFRGGYGISYVHQNRMGSGDLLGINGPQVVIAQIQQTDPTSPTFRNTDQGYPLDMASPSKFNPQTSNVLYMPKDTPDPRVQSWYVSVQRELGWNLVLDIGYIGNYGVNLPVMGDYNQAAPQPTPTSNLSLNARRPIQGFGAVSWFNTGGFSDYNGLQVKLQRRFANGLHLLNSFTYSKTMDNSTQALDDRNGNQSSVQDIHNLAAEKAASTYDQKYVDVLSLVYQLPFGKGQKYGASMPTVVNHVLGGWELTVINNAISAPPINLRAWSGSVPSQFQTVGNLPAWKGGEAFRPNITGPIVAEGSAKTVDNFFNKDNIQLPTDPTKPFGNAGRNIARAFPLNQMDLGLFKNFALPREGMRLQFRSEFFNALNHTNFTAPNGDRSSAAFGTVRGTFQPRQIQFALKLTF